MQHDDPTRPHEERQERFPARGSRSQDVPHRGEDSTRASIFLRLGAANSERREVGWKEFSDRYSRVIRGYARSRGLNDQDAEDVVQDVLLGFFRVSPRFEYDPARGRFRGFLMRATQNAIRQRWRRERRHMHGQASPEFVGDEVDVDAWDREWTDQILQRAMTNVRARFESKTVEAFELQALRGVSATTVAAALGMSVDSAHQAKSRVQKAVRAEMDAIKQLEG